MGGAACGFHVDIGGRQPLICRNPSNASSPFSHVFFAGTCKSSAVPLSSDERRSNFASLLSLLCILDVPILLSIYFSEHYLVGFSTLQRILTEPFNSSIYFSNKVTYMMSLFYIRTGLNLIYDVIKILLNL